MTTDNNPRAHTIRWPDDVSNEDLTRMVRAGVSDGGRLRSGALGDLLLAAGRGVVRLCRAGTLRRSRVAHPASR